MKVTRSRNVFKVRMTAEEFHRLSRAKGLPTDKRSGDVVIRTPDDPRDWQKLLTTRRN